MTDMKLQNTRLMTMAATLYGKLRKVNRKVEGVPQLHAAASSWHQEDEKKNRWRVQNKQTNTQEAQRLSLSSPNEAAILQEWRTIF